MKAKYKLRTKKNQFYHIQKHFYIFLIEMVETSFFYLLTDYFMEIDLIF